MEQYDVLSRKQLESVDNVFKSGCSDGTMVSKVYYNINTRVPCEVRITTIIKYKRIDPKLNEEQVLMGELEVMCKQMKNKK
jgi:hypothetical protein